MESGRFSVNYSAVEARKRIIANGGEALFVASFIIVAGYFLETVNGSGRSAAPVGHTR
ncbi:hypothetical protein V2I52_09870 [Brenneria sp. g21c3]|uniref:hypothetical protein n=1 Tax=Brenneria sp. g21c3 TaxID=3093893 RepID=UPI002EA7A347|nr:hypothetical protein [Brenneria sp. g21c3]